MLRVIELFAGVGSQTQALKNIGIEHEIVGISEIDKYAIQSYEAIHGKVNNFGDITKIDKLPYCDLLTYSFPCQTISISGKQEGFSKHSGTRSGLLWEVERLLEVSEKPKYLLLENVKNLVSKKFKPDFLKWLHRLDELGYNSYWQVLNAKDYGIPQNRERVFVVSIRKDINQYYSFPVKKELKIFLKDLLQDNDNNILDKYFLSERIIKFFNKHRERHKGFGWKPKEIDKCEIAHTITTKTFRSCNDYLIIAGKLNHYKFDELNRVYDAEGISPTLKTMTGGDRQPKIIVQDIPQIVKKRKYKVEIELLKKVLNDCKNREKLTIREISQKTNETETKVAHWFRTDESFSIPDPNVWFTLKELLKIKTDEFDKSLTCFEEDYGVYEKANRVYDAEGISPTLTTQGITNIKIDKSISPSIAKNFQRELNEIAKTDKDIYHAKCDSGFQDNKIGINISQTLRAQNSFTPCLDNNLTIRRLTPLECWRLMGFNDEQFNKAKNAGVSDTQLYKQAGNSIVVNVLEEIFNNLFMIKNKENNKQNDKIANLFV